MVKRELLRSMNKTIPAESVYWQNMYIPSRSKILRTYDILNTLVFKDRLTPCKIATKTPFNAWAFAYQMPKHRTEIWLNGRFPCEQFFIAVLGHEMVHQWQWDVSSKRRWKQGKEPKTDHDDTFYQWQDTFDQYNIHFGEHIPHYYE